MSDWLFRKAALDRLQWLIPGIDYDVLVVRPADLRGDEEYRVLVGEEACQMAGEWFESDWERKRDLENLLYELRRGELRRDLLAELRAALRSGDLVAVKISACSTVLSLSVARMEAAERERRQRESDAFNKARPLYRPQPSPPEALHRYSIRFIDDTGTPVSGVRLKLEIQDTPRMATTDASGVAAVDWFSTTAASLRVLEQPAVEQKVAAQWARPRSCRLPTGPHVQKLQVGVPFRLLSVPADAETTVVIERPGVWIEVRVVNQDAQPVAGCEYRIEHSNGRSITGITNAQGTAWAEGIESEDCAISFPQYGQESDWACDCMLPGQRARNESCAVELAAGCGGPIDEGEAGPTGGIEDVGA